MRHLEERKTGEKKGTCLSLIRVLGKLIVVRVSFLGYSLAKNNQERSEVFSLRGSLMNGWMEGMKRRNGGKKKKEGDMG